MSMDLDGDGIELIINNLFKIKFEEANIPFLYTVNKH